MTALGLAVATVLAATPLAAGGGHGGGGGLGGADSELGAGSAGTGDAFIGGGGGGAGATGGHGGMGQFPGGDGGAAAVGGRGGDGGDAVGPAFRGGGGGGGAHGHVGVLVPGLATIGGHGGRATGSDDYGGGGGAGGYGAVVTGNGGMIGLSVTGGRGGVGGDASYGGDGGSGGNGLIFTQAATATVNAAVAGGDGGSWGQGDIQNGVVGTGGVGIAGSNLTLTLGAAASVTGGLSGDGATRANAITFGGLVNRLELRPGASVTGRVVATGASTFALGGATSGSFDIATLAAAGAYSGFSSFSKTGSGAWTLTGVGAFAGPAIIDAGALVVNGDTTSFSSLTVKAGATLGGSGTVGATTIDGGTLAPGNSIGRLSVQGHLTFNAGSTYAVEVSPASADRVDVTGAATLGGATVATAFAAGVYVARQYTILTATGGVSGAFATLTNTNLPAAFKTGLSYDANSAYLDLALDFTPPTTPSPGTVPEPAVFGTPSAAGLRANRGLTTNQTSVANALARSFNSNGSIPIVYGALDPAGLSQAAGEPATAVQQTSFDAMNRFMDVMASAAPQGQPLGTEPGIGGSAAFASSSGEASKQIATPLEADPDRSRWRVWGGGFGARQTSDGAAVVGSASVTSHVQGLAVGANFTISPSTVAGFSLAAGETGFTLTARGSGRSDLFQAGAFIRHHVGQAYMAATLAYGFQNLTIERMAGLDPMQAQFGAGTGAGRLEGGYRFNTDWLSLTPYAAAQVAALALPGYAERAISSSGLFALTYAARTVSTGRTELGARADATYGFGGVALTLRGGLGWVHNIGTDRRAKVAFQAVPDSVFVVNGAAQARHALRVATSAELKWTNGFSVAAAFDGEISASSRSYGGKGVLRYVW